MAVPVYLELGTKRVFACSTEWPGWCRAGKQEEAALDALAAATPRYAQVAAEAGVTFRVGAHPQFEVVERLAGSASTDFGVIGEAAGADRRPLSAKEAARLAAIVAASWRVLDAVVAGAPAVLRKGPRGGGRDRDAIAEHVLAAEVAYARKLGVNVVQPDISDGPAIASEREAILTSLSRARAATPAVDKGWLPRYAARRIAWHILDHAWEIEDRADNRAGGGA